MTFFENSSENLPGQNITQQLLQSQIGKLLALSQDTLESNEKLLELMNIAANDFIEQFEKYDKIYHQLMSEENLISLENVNSLRDYLK